MDIKFDPIFILLVLAFLLMIFLLIFGNYKNTSSSLRSSRRRKILLGQLTVVMLIVATIVTLAWPIEGMAHIVQGVLLCLLVLVPAVVLHLLASLHYWSSYSDTNFTAESRTKEWFEANNEEFCQEKDGSSQSVKSKKFDTSKIANDPMEFETDTMPVLNLPDDDDWSEEQNTFNVVDEIKETTERKPLATVEALSGIPKPYKKAEAPIEEPVPVVEEQVERVSSFVQSFDLGEDEPVSLSDEDSSTQPVRSAPRQAPTFGDVASVRDSTTELESMGHNEITGLVTTLKRDNGRLQKLVIAQHAVIESERESNNRSRDVARDAIKIMRDAQSQQKMAEKIARRERTERKRVQNEYRKITSALENAMSIVAVNKEKATFHEEV